MDSCLSDLECRAAKESDFDAILGMAGRFWEFAPYKVPFCRESARDYLLLAHSQGLLVVAVDENDTPQGYSAGACAPLMGNRNYKIGQELSFWLNEEYRRGRNAIKLLKCIEEHAKEAGVTFWVMMCMSSSEPDKVKKFYQMNGYTECETYFLKVFEWAQLQGQ